MEHKKGDVFWLRRKSGVGGAPKDFMRIIELSSEARSTNLNQFGDDSLYSVKYLRHYSNNPHRVKKVASEYDLENFWVKMTEEEAYLAKMLFQILDFAEYNEQAKIKAKKFLKKLGMI